MPDLAAKGKMGGPKAGLFWNQQNQRVKMGAFI
jgi:hypothetical protein